MKCVYKNACKYQDAVCACHNSDHAAYLPCPSHHYLSASY